MFIKLSVTSLLENIRFGVGLQLPNKNTSLKFKTKLRWFKENAYLYIPSHKEVQVLKKWLRG